MKTLRLIGTTLLMVVLCLNFTACGDDDDDDSSNPLVGVWQNDDEGKQCVNKRFELALFTHRISMKTHAIL